MRNKRVELFNKINEELINRKMRHIQILFRIRNHQPAMQFTSVDTDAYQAKVRAIIDEYQLEIIRETKTTITCAI